MQNKLKIQLTDDKGVQIYDSSIILPDAPLPTSLDSQLFLADASNLPDGIVTSEYAFWNPNDVNAKRSKVWEMTSGTLLVKGGQFYSGVPNDGKVDILSNINNSRVFRLNTVRKDFLNVSVKTQLKLVAQSSSTAWPPVSWDGVHVFLRYQDQFNLYYASVNRRDGKCIIKKKRKDGPKPENGGTYTELGSYTPYAWVPGTLQNVVANVINLADGTVLITLSVNNKTIMHVIDDGKNGVIDGKAGNWGAPITVAGATGIRGDNSEFFFNKFQVDAI